MKPQGHVAWITGGAQGIGKTVAERLVLEGVQVVIVDLCSKDKGDAAAREISATPKAVGKAVFFRADVTDSKQLKESLDYPLQVFGQVATIVFNNAGIVCKDEDAHWKKMIDVNLTAVIEGTHFASQLMVQHGKTGVVINTASVAGLGPVPLTPAYAASKHGVVGFTSSCYPLFQQHKIRVACICPALVETPAVGDWFKNEMAQQGKALKKLSKNPLHTEDIASVFMTLLHDDSFVCTVAGVTKQGAWVHDHPYLIVPDQDALITPTPRL